MHISDMLGQYQRNITGNSSEELKGVSGIQKMVSTVGQLSAGNIFEGTVQSVHGGKVTLALSNGQMLSARLDGKLSLQAGTPMFFQVKSNDGSTVSIRPYMGGGNTGNPILLNALTTAGIPVSARNLSMIDQMMREQLPIDKQSVLDMARIVGSNPEIPVQTAVEMTKLGIPVTNELAAQFENYRSDGAAVLQEMNLAMDQLAELLGDESVPKEAAVKLNQDILEIILNGKESLPETAQNADGADNMTAGTGAAGNGQEPAAIETADGGFAGRNSALSKEGVPLGQLLNSEQLAGLNRLILDIPALSQQSELFLPAEEDLYVDTMKEDGQEPAGEQVLKNTEQLQELDSDVSAEQFLKLVAQGLSEQDEASLLGAKKLLGSKEYKTLLKAVMEKQWLVRPEELTAENKVKELYERLQRQMRQLDHVIKAAGLEQNSFSRTSADIQNNIEFMNQINQAYTYVQLPLKLSGQNANADLYVYTNKKNFNNPDAELTAFLHLDLDHLGSTDVSVKLQRKHVQTKFYFFDDESYALVRVYLPMLEEKLKQKGYSCTLSVENEEKQVNFVEDFLRKDYPTAGTLHRYSFDVRT